MPLETRSPCYDRECAPALRIRALALRSNPAALRPGAPTARSRVRVHAHPPLRLLRRPADHGSLAVATIAGGALRLSPLSSVVALRPSLGHLDAADEAKRQHDAQQDTAKAARTPAEGDGDDEDEEGGARLTPLQVRRRLRRRASRKADGGRHRSC